MQHMEASLAKMIVVVEKRIQDPKGFVLGLFSQAHLNKPSTHENYLDNFSFKNSGSFE